MSSEPPRRPPYQPPAGGGGGGFYRHPVKPTKKRPRDTVADRDGTEADASAAAAAAAANAPPPPNLRQLRRDNAHRWEEVVRLRERLARRESERRRRGGDLPAPAQAAAAAEHGPIIGEAQLQEVENNRSIDRLGPLDRRLAAHRAELALLVQQQEPQGQAAAEDQQQQQQQRQDERNVRAIQAHRSMIQNARLHQAQLFGNEIIETYDGLAQLHAHLDRAIGVAPRDDNNNNNAGAAAADAEDNAAAAAANADNDEGVDGGIVAQDRTILTLHDRIAEAEARVEEHRVIHAALMDMLQRRRSNDNAQETSQDNHDGADGAAATAVVPDAAVAERIVAVGQPIRSNTDAAAEEAQRIHAEMVYFAQRFDAHLDRMEQVAATAAREEREGDTLSDDEDNNGDDDTEGGANGAAGRAGTGNKNNNRARPSSSTSSSSSQNPFLATLFVDLARRMVSNPEDPYVSIEAVIGASAGASSSSSGRQRRIERRRGIIHHLLASGVLVQHTDNADLICFNYFE